MARTAEAKKGAASPRDRGADIAKNPSRFLNRELSWLDFNSRVLELARDRGLPLLERVFFCSIFSSNLDEFFMVRVAGLRQQEESGVAVRSIDGRTPTEVLAHIRERVLENTAEQSALWSEELKPELAAHGIRVAGMDDCNRRERDEAEGRFNQEVFPVLTPLAVGPGHPFPYISGLSLSLAVFVRDPATEEERFARIKVPETLPRFMRVGTRGLLIPLEDVIGRFTDRLFPGMDIVEQSLFRVTRDADYELSDDANDLLEAVEQELRQRPFRDVVRMEVSSDMSRRLRRRLMQGMGVREQAVLPVNGLLDLSEVTQISRMDIPELKFKKWSPVTQARLAKSREPDEFFKEIRRRDIFVHHPYDSFATSFEAFVKAAAQDPDVVGLKTTVYRTSDDSLLVPALIEAASEDKQSVCLVELKARFDERRNIEWSRKMEQAGVHVVYGFSDLKIHAKTTLVVRHEGDALRRYVHISTGNYNAVTARLYEDAGLFTADEELAADVAALFNYLTGFGRPYEYKRLLVAPGTLRKGLVARIRAVSDAADRGERAAIRIKVNAITDGRIIDELYRASQRGVKIDMVVRGICALRPGIDGLSENIRVVSVLGRFLEHSRLYVFEHGEERSYLMGSADLMPRNLDNRIEILAPVEDPDVQKEIDAVHAAAWADDRLAWTLRPDGAWMRVSASDGGKARSSQKLLMRTARKRDAGAGRSLAA